jgi:4-alpha-glucanotransferase
MDTSRNTPMDSMVLQMGRQAGVGMHVTSLPGDHGVGDIADSAIAFVDQLAEMNIGVWQFLPLGPTAYGDSPYQPLSAFAGNVMLLGLSPLVESGLLEPGELEDLAALPHDYCDYGRLIPAKGALLARAAERFLERGGNGLMADYEDFLNRNATQWLDDYAIFRVLKDLHGQRPWPEWEQDYVRRDPAAMARARDEHRSTVEHTRIKQFLFDRQWQALRAHAGERGVTLFGDMPIYIALDSADAWSHPEMLLIDRDGRPSAVAGVPPDYFSEDGQLWGNPLYDWAYHERTVFQWWVERMRHAARQTDIVRIDHFRGFESFWSVPFGAKTAKDGEWLPGPRDALFVAMERALGKLPIVAEDLGVITPEVDALRENHGIPGMVVLQFEVDDPEFDPDEVPENSVCYTGTHDNDTTAGWFRGNGDDTRTAEEIEATRANALKFTGGKPETIARDMIRLAFSTEAVMAVAPMQDYLGLGSRARLNTPGTTLNNWRWRMGRDDLTPGLVESVAEMVSAASRVPERRPSRAA